MQSTQSYKKYFSSPVRNNKTLTNNKSKYKTNYISPSPPPLPENMLTNIKKYDYNACNLKGQKEKDEDIKKYMQANEEIVTKNSTSVFDEAENILEDIKRKQDYLEKLELELKLKEEKQNRAEKELEEIRKKLLIEVSNVEREKRSVKIGEAYIEGHNEIYVKSLTQIIDKEKVLNKKEEEYKEKIDKLELIENQLILIDDKQRKTARELEEKERTLLLKSSEVDNKLKLLDMKEKTFAEYDDLLKRKFLEIGDEENTLHNQINEYKEKIDKLEKQIEEFTLLQEKLKLKEESFNKYIKSESNKLEKIAVNFDNIKRNSMSPN